ncbi:MAG: glycine cleavage system aminomethyltransferase GcvT [Desulfobacterales bacterium]
MPELLRTPLFERHCALGATLVEFGGWEMPIHYPGGIVQEHLATRDRAGIFDVSHMGRIRVQGRDALAFLLHVLTNNAAALEPGEAQYTMIANPAGGALDDAYLYRFLPDEYLLVVNASNRRRDWDHLQAQRERTPAVALEDLTGEMAMVSLQGPSAKEILAAIVGAGRVPEPLRNRLGIASFGGARMLIGRTGYTGEPLGFEMFIERGRVAALWDRLMAEGAQPVGLGARDTLRLEAALPLYGHELGLDPDRREIPIFACQLARFAVSFSPLKGDFIGREALARQFDAYRRIVRRDYSLIRDLPRMVQAVAVVDKGIARTGAAVFHAGKAAGIVTSGTMVPYWQHTGLGIASMATGEKGMRAIGLALLDSDRVPGDELEIDIRGRMVRARIVPYHLRNEAPPRARPILWNELQPEPGAAGAAAPPSRAARRLVEKTVANTLWRRHDTINLIPSENTSSALVRLLSIMDPAGRYAEHKTVKAFKEAEVFYYQGTDFIAEVERLLVEQLKQFLGCTEVETRLVSGQMANMAVYSAMVDYLNRANRKSEQRRLRKVMNHHIIKGGHLSAQPMGALRDFVVRDARSEKPAVVNFPVMADNPFQIDVGETRRLLAEHRPELVILGKSMILHREPVRELRAAIDDLGLDTVLLYDMAHVLGLAGPHFQEPFREGADIVTGSTHKTFLGTQRGIAAVRFAREEARFELWEAIQRRTFPGSVSNHHLGTLLGLLMAVYEMNHFKDEYAPRVVANAKAFAQAMRAAGLDVAGDPAVSFTETHQVIVKVGYGRGAEIARRLEENNIILNYQAAPDEEGFTAAGALRMGVQEMTRFGMGPAGFAELAQLMADGILRSAKVKDAVRALRRRFQEMRYCFGGAEMEAMLQQLHRLV